jgi:hypothetical protein
VLGDQARRDLYEANYVQFKRKWHRYTKDWDQPPPPSGLRRLWPFGRSTRSS